MQTQPITPSARADGCTPLHRLLTGVTIAESLSADLKKGTWTFKTSPHQTVAAGKYILIPATVAADLLTLEQEAAKTPSSVHLPAPTNTSARFSHRGDCLTISADDGFEADYYRDHIPNEQTKGYWHPAHWRSHEHRRDTTGRKWWSLQTYVQDDFGMLVRVAA